MQSSHVATAVSSAFDDPNLIAYGGLEPVVRLAERCGLPALADELIRLPASKDGTGAFPAAKLMSLVGGMAAGADSIDDMDRLRHGAMGRLFAGVRAPSTLGSFLRSFTHGHVKQLHAVARRFLPALARHTPLLPGADQIAYVDIDDTIRRTYGYANPPSFSARACRCQPRKAVTSSKSARCSSTAAVFSASRSRKVSI
jgi:hypothetical protein